MNASSLASTWLALAIEALGWTLLHFLWQGAAVALLLWIFLLLARKAAPQVRYLAGCAALALMCGAAVSTFVLQTRASKLPVTESPTVTAQTEPDASADVFRRDVSMPARGTEMHALPHDAPDAAIVVRPAAGEAALTPHQDDAILVSVLKSLPQAAAGWAQRLEPWLPWIVGLWALGVAFFSLRLLAGWRAVRGLSAAAGDTADEMWRARFSRLKERLGVSYPVRLVFSTRAAVPMVIGWLKPAVLVPAGLVTGLNAAQLEAILAHELIHIRRHDYLLNLVQNVVETLLFYHPAVAWVSGRIRIEREHCCDDAASLACGGVLDYARALAALAELRRAPALSVAATGGSLVQRIRRLAGATETDARRGVSPGAAILLPVALAFVALSALDAAVAQQRTLERISDPNRTPIAEAKPPAKATAEIKPVASKDKPADVITIRGQVLRPDGRPAAGAKVSVVRSFWGAGEKWHSLVTTASAGVGGEFEIRIPKSQPDDGRDSQGGWIVAEAPGFGMEWTGFGMRKLDPSKPVVLKLVPEFPIHGRVVDSEGKPIRDVRVKVMEQNTPNDGEDLGPWLQAVKSENHFAANRLLRRWLHIFDDETQSPIATDQDGRFVLGGIGSERVAHLELRGEIAYAQIDVVTRAIKPIARKTEPGVMGQVFGADFTYEAQPTRPIVGTVLEAGTGRPLAGMRIESGPLPGALIQPRGVATETDAHGKYRLVGLPKRRDSRRGRGNEIAVVPNDVQPYFMTRREVPDTPGFEPVTLNIELTRGLWILGEVTDKATGRPVPSQLTYYPFLSNPFAQKSPQFRQSFMTGSSYRIGDNMRYLTRSDGTFRLVGLPGRGIVAADALPWAARPTQFAWSGLYRKGVGASEIAGMDKDASFPTYRNMNTASSKRNDALKEINPPAGTPAVICNLVLDAGGTIWITVVDRDGKPVGGCLINHGRADSGVLGMGGSLKSTFELTGLEPNESHSLVMYQPRQKIGKVVTVSYGGQSPHSVTVTLEPCATVKGRLVNEEGVPFKNVNISVKAHGSFGTLFAPPMSVECDADGRFLCANLAPGCDYYSLQVFGGGLAGATVVEKLVIAAGKTIDLGDVKVKPRSANE